MNLKEIAFLLIGLFLGSSLLIVYKYYVAKGKVFQITRVLVFKYILRFILLIAYLFLCYYTITIKQNKDSVSTHSIHTLLVISANSSSLTWNSLVEKVNDMPINGTYSLGIYDHSSHQVFQVIPQTNQDSFLHLVEHAHEVQQMTLPKLLFTDHLSALPSKDQFDVYYVSNGHWVSQAQETNHLSIFSNSNLNLNSWIASTYVRIYAVILILVLLFIDSVFTAKAIKI